MRRYLVPLVLVATVCAVTIVAYGQSTAPAVPQRCTWVGTITRNVKTGTAGNNILCSLNGRDYLHGAGGNDEVIAGKGRDTAIGGKGRDILQGNSGRDKLFAVDGRGGDKVSGGPGVDQCFIDPGYQVTGCEEVFRSQEPQMAGALGSSLLQVMEIVEESPTVAPGSTVTQTLTQTITTAVPCPTGPPQPEPFCGP